MMGPHPDSTLGKRKIVIGMPTPGIMNKQIVRHFQPCQSMIPSLRTKIRQMGSVGNRKNMSTYHVRPPGERTLTR